MPAVSKSQQRAAAMALHATVPLKGAAKQMRESMTDEELEHYARTKRKGLPEKKDGDMKKSAAIVDWKAGPGSVTPTPSRPSLGDLSPGLAAATAALPVGLVGGAVGAAGGGAVGTAAGGIAGLVRELAARKADEDRKKRNLVMASLSGAGKGLLTGAGAGGFLGGTIGAGSGALLGAAASKMAEAEAFCDGFFEACATKGVPESRIEHVVKTACAADPRAAAAFEGLLKAAEAPPAPKAPAPEQNANPNVRRFMDGIMARAQKKGKSPMDLKNRLAVRNVATSLGKPPMPTV